MEKSRQSYLKKKEKVDEKDSLMQLVGFKIGKEHFGLNILMVQEIIRIVPITTVPNAPDFIEGVINLRGGIIPVVDLRKRLKLRLNKVDPAQSTRILIVNVESVVTGYVVDSVTRVMKIQTSSIEPPPDIVLAGLKSKYITGVCEIDNQLLILLDFAHILFAKELEAIEAMGGVSDDEEDHDTEAELHA